MAQKKPSAKQRITTRNVVSSKPKKRKMGMSFGQMAKVAQKKPTPNPEAFLITLINGQKSRDGVV